MAVPQSFPAKIYQILENESPDIIQWNENGVSFRIVDHGRFEREIVPKYFRHNQISSVQRQLNLYGFKCISRGEFKRSFFHPKFRRGDWETVRKLTRFVPVKKTSQMSSDDMPTAPDSASNPDDRKRDERMVQPPMYNPYFYPIPGANMPGQPGPDYMARNYMMASAGAQPNGAWPESWDRQESANNLNARMMGMPAHFAYSMIPMHAAAAMQQHMTSAPLQNTSNNSSSSNSNVARLDTTTRSSELSNRLGFKFGVNGIASPADQPTVPTNSSTSASSSTSLLANSTTSNAPAAASRVQENAEHAHPLSLAHAHAHAHQNNASNAEYDFMVEFGMFDGMHMPEAPHPHPHLHSSGSAHSLGQMRLPTITHGLAAESPSSSSNAGNAESPVHSTGSSASLHAHAALEVDASSGAHPGDSSDHVKTAPVVTTSTTTSSTSTAATSTTTSTSCDMGCNTLLTYSKIHDALVYRVGDL